MSEKITEKAILATLSIGQWTARKQDKKVERDIEEKYQAHDAGTYRKALIAKEAINLVSEAVNEIRTFHYTNTLPWTDEGKRLLPIENFQTYTEEMRKWKSAFQFAVDSFVTNYPDLIQEAERRLNGLFNPNDYPAPADIRRKFYFDLSFDPVPEAGDFRVNLQQEEIDKMRKDLEMRTQTATEMAMKNLYARLHDAIKHAQERLSDPKAIFRDSLIDNIVDLLKILPSLNVTDDPTLEKLRQEASERLTKYDADTLREDKTARTETADNASDLLRKMEGLY